MTDPGKSEAVQVELPARGYPPSEEAVSNWFRGRVGREPAELELGMIIGAMAQREATRPHDHGAPPTEAWITGPLPSRIVHD